MRTLMTLLTIFLISSTTLAQQGINYKAVLKDASGNLLADTFMNVQFSIHQDTPTGTIVYQEDHNYTTDANGLLVLSIGSDASPSIGVFSDINWGLDQHYLQITINYSGGTINFDATEFMAVPYAKHALTASTAITASNVTTKINQLTDAKSDDDGTSNGSSVFLGVDSGLADDGTNNRNVGIGFETLEANTFGYNNVAAGHSALKANTEGHSNIAIGANALLANTTGTRNLAFGSSALAANTEGIENSASGLDAMRNNTTGNQNTATGYNALYTNIAGNGNVALGNQAGYYETGSNKLYIANSDTATPLIYGEFDNKKLTLNAATTVHESNNSNSAHAISGIKTHTGMSDAYGVYGENIVSDNEGTGVHGFGGKTGVNGVAIATAGETSFGLFGNVIGTAGTRVGVRGQAFGSSGFRYGVYSVGDLLYTGDLIALSDRKLKTNIKKLNKAISTIMSLQPSTYNFKDGYQESMQASNKPQFGFMAQELQTVLPQLVSQNKYSGAKKEDPEISFLGINYTGLIPILTAGIQEQQAKIQNLEAKLASQNQTIEEQNKSIKSLIKRMDSLEASMN